MSKSICPTIRRQLDDMMLGEQGGSEILRHLGECHECREFHKRQTKLRQLVGSLGTVNAPPDFDFRLRSRLSNDQTNGRFHLSSSVWWFGYRAAAAVAAIVMIVGAVAVVRQFQSKRQPTTTVAEKSATPTAGAVTETLNATATNNEPSESASTGLQPKAKVDRVVIRTSPVPSRNKRTLVAEDSAFTRAPVVRSYESNPDAVFPVDANQQSLRVSLFDGRGNPKTISLPTVTFGSQRVVPTATSFAPKGVW